MRSRLFVWRRDAGGKGKKEGALKEGEGKGGTMGVRKRGGPDKNCLLCQIALARRRPAEKHEHDVAAAFTRDIAEDPRKRVGDSFNIYGLNIQKVRATEKEGMKVATAFSGGRPRNSNSVRATPHAVRGVRKARPVRHRRQVRGLPGDSSAAGAQGGIGAGRKIRVGAGPRSG
ncbi:hypothetical protein C8J57DRAFT_1234768 [Mycena rebaudengoi]|nr:hypothetical protein C8J57DRAFT_1234768 [Mycena rebaudengoi]